MLFYRMQLPTVECWDPIESSFSTGACSFLYAAAVAAV